MSGRGKGRRRPQGPALAAALAVALLLAAEGALRLFPGEEDREPVVPRGLGRFDPGLGWSNTPSFVGTSSRVGDEIEYRINSRGLRDDETPYAKPAGTRRIVVVGDSRTFGYGVPIEQHFTRLLEGYFPALEVVNLGVSGFGIDQELLFLREEGLRYEPDLVVAYVAHFGEHRHLFGERFGRRKPRFVLEDGELVLEDRPVPNPSVLPEGPVAATHAWLRDHSRLYHRLLGVAWAALDRAEPEAAAEVPAEDHEQDDEALRARSLALAERLVEEMRRDSEARGAEFLLVTQLPDLHAAAVARGMRSLDVSDVLENRLYELPDGLQHLNAAGNGALAWEIARYLRRGRLLAEQDPAATGG